MTFRWTTSQRSFAAIVLASTFVLICLHSLLTSQSFQPRHSRVFDPFFEFTLDTDSDFGLVGGPVVPGELVRSDYELAQVPAPILPSQPEGEHQQTEARPLGKHTIAPNGLLVVNPDGPHPIFQLMRDAVAAWEEKLGRASKTLDEAVAEYKRRYRRPPPLGFDKWWEYVIRNDVQLPDEYDEIFEDIEPFWGIDPTELALAREELEANDGIVIIEKTKTHPRLRAVRSSLPEDRGYLRDLVNDTFKLVREVEEDLPPLRLTLSPFDNPDMMSDWRIKTMALEAAANGTTLTRADFPSITEAGWIQACPPDSPTRNHPPSVPKPSTSPPFPSSSPKTFIASHRDTMNPCTHPSLLTMHGQFLAFMAGPFPRQTLFPRFSLCATTLHHDIRPPVPYMWDYDVDPDPHADGTFEGDLPWERRVDERLGWRGSSTGLWASSDTPWMHAQRERLIAFTSALEGNVSVLDGGKDESVPVGEPGTMRLAAINPAWMDVAFAGRANSCNEGTGTCAKMESLWEFRRAQKRREEGRYKFILDVDGNGWSGRFKRLITSNALIFKATVYPEWYNSRVAPWVHYVPIQVSYTDLYDAVGFFRAHDDLAAKIAKAGRDWSLRFWRRQDMVAYLYRLLLEYARVSSLDRASMDYID